MVMPYYVDKVPTLPTDVKDPDKYMVQIMEPPFDVVAAHISHLDLSRYRPRPAGTTLATVDFPTLASQPDTPVPGDFWGGHHRPP